MFDKVYLPRQTFPLFGGGEAICNSLVLVSDQFLVFAETGSLLPPKEVAIDKVSPDLQCECALSFPVLYISK